MARSKSGAVKSSSVLEVPSRRTKKARPQLYEDFDEQGSAGSDLLDSDELDDDFEGVLSPLKRKRVADRNSSAVKKASNRKRRKPAAVPSDDSEVGFELREGQEIAGKVIEAPQAGRGLLSRYLNPCDDSLIGEPFSSTRADLTEYSGLLETSAGSRM